MYYDIYENNINDIDVIDNNNEYEHIVSINVINIILINIIIYLNTSYYSII